MLSAVHNPKTLWFFIVLYKSDSFSFFIHIYDERQQGTHWSGELFQLRAVPLVKPKSMDGILVILFNNIVQNVENFRATLVIFFKIYWTNFWLALEQTAGGVIWIISRRRLLRAISKRISYIKLSSFLS